MRGVPIKFRGITVKYKEVVYGYLFHCGDKAFIMSLIFYTAGEWETQTDEVDPDSIAQLIGFDIDGNEIYEGDELLSFDNDTLTAACFSNADYKYYRIMKGNADE